MATSKLFWNGWSKISHHFGPPKETSVLSLLAEEDEKSILLAFTQSFILFCCLVTDVDKVLTCWENLVIIFVSSPGIGIIRNWSSCIVWHSSSKTK